MCKAPVFLFSCAMCGVPGVSIFCIVNSSSSHEKRLSSGSIASRHHKSITSERIVLTIGARVRWHACEELTCDEPER